MNRRASGTMDGGTQPKI